MFAKISIFLIITLFSFNLKASDSLYFYFIYFKNKQNNSYSLSKPEAFLSQKSIKRRKKQNINLDSTDLPVSSQYIQSILRFNDIIIVNSSKWLNGILIKTKNKNFKKEYIEVLEFVKKIDFLARIEAYSPPKVHQIIDSLNQNTINKEIENYWGKSENQIEMIGAKSLNMNGNGITISIFDAGFYMAYKTVGMESLRFETTIKKDFVDYDGSVWEDDKHGANCLSFMKTKHPGTYVGTATDAQYVLLRTEDAHNENLTEEFNWLLAAEFSDSLGVDLISSSLGYTTFDIKSTSHQHADLDGKTTVIAQAAEMAFKKGIVVINSAGNEGDSKWRKIGTPADATNVITIGSVDNQGFHSKFSSYGLTFDKRIKPDFVCLGQKALVASPSGVYAGNGTSYSTPMFAGAFASFMALHKNKTFLELKNALILSSTHFNIPDSAYGFGIPDFDLATKILENWSDSLIQKDYFHLKNNPVLFQDLGIHFKSNSQQQIEIQVYLSNNKKKKKIKTIQIEVNQNEWIHNTDILQLYLNLSKKQKKKFQFFSFEFQSKDLNILKKVML